MLTILIAFTSGVVHAFDADHIAAVTAFVRKTPDTRGALLAGLKWGLGHASSVLVAGLIILALKLTIPPAFTSSMEFIVGAVLVALGVLVLKDLMRNRTHLHRHRHGEVVHTHFHSHRSTGLHRHGHTVTLIGALHGLAGTASILVLIPITLLASLQLAVLYIAIFSVGTIMAMALYTVCIGKIFKAFAAKSVKYAANGLVGAFNVTLGLYFMLGAL